MSEAPHKNATGLERRRYTASLKVANCLAVLTRAQALRETFSEVGPDHDHEKLAAVIESVENLLEATGPEPRRFVALAAHHALSTKQQWSGVEQTNAAVDRALGELAAVLPAATTDLSEDFMPAAKLMDSASAAKHSEWAKPDPHLIQSVSTALAALGISVGVEGVGRSGSEISVND